MAQQEILALVLSDLHLGEEDSVFMDREGNLNRNYVRKLRDYLSARLDPTQIQYLILVGDALDLSLARRRQAFPAFKAFLEEMEDLFPETLVYLPGNHDHHLWVALQEEALIFQKIRTGRPVEPYYYALCPRLEETGFRIPGRKLSEPFGKNTFLYHLLPEGAQEKGIGLLVAYPNLYVRFAGFSLLITHGHFFEETWTLFTDVLKRSLRRMGLRRLNFKKLEQINSPFIEFGWYSLGQAGELSRLIEGLWDELHAGGPGPLTTSVLADLMRYLDEKITKKTKPHHGVWGKIEDFFSRLEGGLLELSSDAALKLFMELIKHFILPQLVPEEAPHTGSPLRHAPKILSQKETRERIENYLEMALPAFPTLDTLIFGHTHVPFINGKIEIDTPAGRRQVTCFNTGGWVTDVYDADHLATARPMIFGLSEENVQPLDVPWPDYEEFEDVLEGIEEESEARKRVKELIWRKLS